PLLLRRATRLVLAAACYLAMATLTHAQTFTVPGTSGRNWVDTGIDIQPGVLLQLSAEGRVDVGAGWGAYGPEGTTRFADVPGYPAETRFRYGLVARITPRRANPSGRRLPNPGQSDDGLYEQWSYGDTHQYCTAQGGHLWLTANDDNAGDNSGAFTVYLSRTACPGEAEETQGGVSLYTANSSFHATTQFRLGETIVLKVENNMSRSIYLRCAQERLIRESRLIREEGLQVERFDGSRFVPVLPSGRSRPEQVATDNGDGTGTVTIMDYAALTQLVELRSTWNITRQWTMPAWLGPGTYRLSLVYYGSRNTQGPHNMIYSSTFEVAR
ncbi:MAG: hypothetical protein DMF60_03195, partial [Acidobacteria bacterium]